MNMMRKIDLVCLTQDGLGKDNHLLSIILYFVADMLFLTNGRICFLLFKWDIQSPHPFFQVFSNRGAIM